MSIYWNKDLIKQNYENLKNNKEYFLNKYKNPYNEILYQDTLNSYNNLINSIPDIENKKYYKNDLAYLEKDILPRRNVNKEIQIIVKNAYQDLIKDKRINPRKNEKLQHFNFSNDELIKLVDDFYKSLNHPTLYKKFRTVIDNDNYMINILNNYYNVKSNDGEMVYDPYQNFYYLLIQKNNTIVDAITLAHEISHAIFFDNLTPDNGDIINDSLKELESEIIELLFLDYLKDKWDKQEINYLKKLKILFALNDSGIVLATDIAINNINKNTKNFNYLKIGKEFSKYNIKYNPFHIEDLITPYYDDDCYEVISQLTAFDLYEKNKDNPSKLIDDLFIIKNDSEKDFNNLANKYKITFHKDNLKNTKKYIKRISP